MSDKVRIICIFLVLICIILVLVEKCNAAGEMERLCASTRAQVQAMIAMEESQNQSYGDSYIPGAYSTPSQDITIINQNQNINRTTVVIEPQPQLYYYPVYDRPYHRGLSPDANRQHWDAVNHNRR